jgi:hypothetical protein
LGSVAAIEGGDGLTHLGIEEISRKRGHVYLTNVYDLKTKHLGKGPMNGSQESRREREISRRCQN